MANITSATSTIATTLSPGAQPSASQATLSELESMLPIACEITDQKVNGLYTYFTLSGKDESGKEVSLDLFVSNSTGKLFLKTKNPFDQWMGSKPLAENKDDLANFASWLTNTFATKVDAVIPQLEASLPSSAKLTGFEAKGSCTGFSLVGTDAGGNSLAQNFELDNKTGQLYEITGSANDQWMGRKLVSTTNTWAEPYLKAGAPPLDQLEGKGTSQPSSGTNYVAPPGASGVMGVGNEPPASLPIIVPSAVPAPTSSGSTSASQTATPGYIPFQVGTVCYNIAAEGGLQSLLKKDGMTPQALEALAGGLPDSDPAKQILLNVVAEQAPTVNPSPAFLSVSNLRALVEDFAELPTPAQREALLAQKLAGGLTPAEEALLRVAADLPSSCSINVLDRLLYESPDGTNLGNITFEIVLPVGGTEQFKLSDAQMGKIVWSSLDEDMVEDVTDWLKEVFFDANLAAMALGFGLPGDCGLTVTGKSTGTVSYTYFKIEAGEGADKLTYNFEINNRTGAIFRLTGNPSNPTIPMAEEDVRSFMGAASAKIEIEKLTDALGNNPNGSITGAQMKEAIIAGILDPDGEATGTELQAFEDFVTNYGNKLSPEAKAVFSIYQHYATDDSHHQYNGKQVNGLPNTVITGEMLSQMNNLISFAGKLSESADNESKSEIAPLSLYELLSPPDAPDDWSWNVYGDNGAELAGASAAQIIAYFKSMISTPEAEENGYITANAATAKGNVAVKIALPPAQGTTGNCLSRGGLEYGSFKGGLGKEFAGADVALFAGMMKSAFPNVEVTGLSLLDFPNGNMLGFEVNGQQYGVDSVFGRFHFLNDDGSSSEPITKKTVGSSISNEVTISGLINTLNGADQSNAGFKEGRDCEVLLDLFTAAASVGIEVNGPNLMADSSTAIGYLNELYPDGGDISAIDMETALLVAMQDTNEYPGLLSYLQKGTLSAGAQAKWDVFSAFIADHPNLEEMDDEEYADVYLEMIEEVKEAT